MMGMPSPAWRGGLAGRMPGLGEEAGAGAGGQEAAALPSFLVCWALGAGVPRFLHARSGGTGGCGTEGAWGWKRGCVPCCLGSHSRSSAGV